ncbi:hypothetical protein FRC98_03940 [Lujinxingia vulgaris]|uniref:Peptidase C-terminal archaeal/bacterial domain-containing protein n=1 Tax=Lujinxingia vulgaris TaxID=2600176 RepID=A0A5C6XE26_9DELT|nr:hypothetical protein [Lujinxingia vulgaris]TXD38059.1 hypothetical protein FRC98_03940 [Lujinxingia vulgaris]
MMRPSFHKTPLLRRTLTLLAALALSVACSSEPDGPDRPIDIAEDVGADTDSGDLDGGQPDADAADPTDVEDDADDTDVDATTPDADAEDPDAADADVDEPDASDADADEPDAEELDASDAEEPDAEEPPTECDAATLDLGVLEAGANVVELRADLGTVAGFDACEGSAPTDSVILRFELAENSQIAFPSSDATLLQSTCSAVGAFCVDAGVAFNALSGVELYVAVERPTEASSITIDVTPLVPCSPEGERTCVDGARIEACTTGFASPQVATRVVVDCPQGCEDNACLGDTCANPILVDSAVTVEAPGEALSNSFDNQGATGCSWDTPSLGREVVFQVDHVEAGENIEITITDPLRFYRVSIMQSCSETAECLESAVLGSVLTYEAPASGTYFVVVDAEFDLPAAPEISVEVHAVSEI